MFRKLSQDISKLESLQYLKLELFCIPLRGEDIELFFADLAKLASHLTHLSLYFWCCQIELPTADKFSNGIINLPNLISLRLSVCRDRNPLDWDSHTFIGVSRLTKLNTFIPSKEISNSNKIFLIKYTRNLVNF